jgi:hypothetical protein
MSSEYTACVYALCVVRVSGGVVEASACESECEFSSTDASANECDGAGACV